MTATTMQLPQAPAAASRLGTMFSSVISFFVRTAILASGLLQSAAAKGAVIVRTIATWAARTYLAIAAYAIAGVKRTAVFLRIDGLNWPLIGYRAAAIGTFSLAALSIVLLLPFMIVGLTAVVACRAFPLVHEFVSDWNDPVAQAMAWTRIGTIVLVGVTVAVSSLMSPVWHAVLMGVVTSAVLYRVYAYRAGRYEIAEMFENETCMLRSHALVAEAA